MIILNNPKYLEVSKYLIQMTNIAVVGILILIVLPIILHRAFKVKLIKGVIAGALTTIIVTIGLYLFMDVYNKEVFDEAESINDYLKSSPKYVTLDFGDRNKDVILNEDSEVYYVKHVFKKNNNDSEVHFILEHRKLKDTLITKTDNKYLIEFLKDESQVLVNPSLQIDKFFEQ